MRGRLAALLATVITVTGVLATPPAASAAPPSTRHYLALGDSLAFGYQPVRPLDRTEGYVYQLHTALAKNDPRLRLSNLGCLGETTGSFVDGGVCAYPDGSSQLVAAERLLREHGSSIRLVTLDVGANDVLPCVRGGVIDRACVAQALVAVATNTARIVARLRAVAPRTPIVAMTYYDPYLAAWLSGPTGRELARQSMVVLGLLNAILITNFRRGRVDVADVAGAFSTFDTTPVDGVPLNVVRICQWTWMCAAPPLGPDIHANKQGYAVIAGAFLDRLRTPPADDADDS